MKKLLLVEDDQFLSDIIARKLSVEGATLIHASDYEGAMKELKDKTPDLILLDI
ncbi:MAG: Response regulator, partial [Parcubacteria group bacterium GW2011_GWA2_47_9]